MADIENRSDGSVIAIDTFDGERHYRCMSWAEWLSWLRSAARDNKKLRTIYAHNGGGWDWLSLIEYVIHNRGDEELQTIQNNNRIIAVTLKLGNHVTLQLMDSIFLFGSPPCSLDQAGKKYVGRGKVEIDALPEVIWRRNKRQFWKYLEGDCELLYDVVSAIADIVYTKIAPINRLRLTLPATALHCFRTGYLDREIGTPEDEQVRLWLRKAYCGGRVEVFRPGYHAKVNVYDFNSLYPSVMYDTPVPVTGNVRWTRKLDLDSCGVFHVRFSQTDKSKLPLLLVKGRGAYSGEGFYFTNELRRFPGKLHVLGGFVFGESGVIFRRYVDKLYRLRMTDKAGPLGNVCKLLLNSLYGKFGQKPVRTKTLCVDSDRITELLEAGAVVEVISEALDLYRVSEESRVAFEHVGIAGTITSEARARLWENMDARTVYCDTDSVHTPGVLPVDADTLGALKLEDSGQGIYAGKKLYALQSNTGKEKVRAKGVRLGGKFGFTLDFAGLRSLVDGSKIVCRFQSASSANTVLRGGHACVFQERKRTLRNTADDTRNPGHCRRADRGSPVGKRKHSNRNTRGK